MAHVPGTRMNWSGSSWFVAALFRLFPALVEASVRPEHLYLEES